MITPATRQLFPLDENVTYLNHGGFGVTPCEVIKAQKAILDKIEKSPAAYFERACTEEKQKMAAFVARRFSLRAQNVALVENVTDGVNAVLRSIRFQPDDEILITSFTYGGTLCAIQQMAKTQGVKIVQAELNFPLVKNQGLSAVQNAITKRTKLGSGLN